MGEALLTVKSLNAWYSNEKMILSDFSFALGRHEVAGITGLCMHRLWERGSGRVGTDTGLPF